MKTLLNLIIIGALVVLGAAAVGFGFELGCIWADQVAESP